MSGFSWPVRVYLEDTDAQGVVYNASYFRFMERARTEWLRDRGIDHDELRSEYGIVLVLAAIDARFRSAARLSDELIVGAEVISAGGARLAFRQRIVRSQAPAVEICDARAEVACVDVRRQRPCRWPHSLLEEFCR